MPKLAFTFCIQGLSYVFIYFPQFTCISLPLFIFLKTLDFDILKDSASFDTNAIWSAFGKDSNTLENLPKLIVTSGNALSKITS